MAPRAENKLGRWGATSYMIGNTIGSGIFITPTTILKNTKSVGISLVIWLVSAGASLMIALCYVELGTSIRKSGADFAYMCHAKLYAIAFAFMTCGCVFLYPITLAVQAETFAEYVLRTLRVKFCDNQSTEVFLARKTISAVTIWLLLFLNFFSVRTIVARFQIVASFAKILATFAVILCGLYVLVCTETGYTNLRDPFANPMPPPENLTSAFFAGLFSFDGWDVLNYGVEELADPAKSMMFAAVLGMCSVTVIFLLMNISYFIVLTIPQFMLTDAIALTFGAKLHPIIEHLMALLVSLVLIGSMNSTLFSASRFLYAAARSGQFPACISCVNARYDSPRFALFLHVLLAIFISFIGDIAKLVDYIGFSQWSQRLVTVILLLYIRWSGLPVHPDAVRLPILLPLVFLLASFGLIITTVVTKIGDVWPTPAILFVSFIIYIVWFTDWCPLVSKNLTICYYADKLNERSSRLAQIIFNGIIDRDTEEDSDEIEEKPEPAFEVVPKNGHNKQF